MTATTGRRSTMQPTATSPPGSTHSAEQRSINRPSPAPASPRPSPSHAEPSISRTLTPAARSHTSSGPGSWNPTTASCGAPAPPAAFVAASRTASTPVAAASAAAAEEWAEATEKHDGFGTRGRQWEGRAATTVGCRAMSSARRTGCCRGIVAGGSASVKPPAAAASSPPRGATAAPGTGTSRSSTSDTVAAPNAPGAGPAPLSAVSRPVGGRVAHRATSAAGATLMAAARRICKSRARSPVSSSRSASQRDPPCSPDPSPWPPRRSLSSLPSATAAAERGGSGAGTESAVGRGRAGSSSKRASASSTEALSASCCEYRPAPTSRRRAHSARTCAR